MNKKQTVSIGIPAYNEAKNITNLLNSLFLQKGKNFALSEIIVNSDAGTDETVNIIKSLQKDHPEIKLITNKTRRGKYFRVNQLFHTFTSDILIVLDADIALVGNDFIEKLLRPIINDPQAKMVTAHNILLRPHNFIGKVIHANFTYWDFIRLSFPKYNHASNFYGTATAYTRDFALSVHIPEDLTDPHVFIYLSAKRINGFRYCRQAEVVQWPITDLSDYIKFFGRTIGKKDKKVEKIFNIRTEEVYNFPFKYRLIGLIKAMIYRPFYTPAGIVVSLYAAKQASKNKGPIWEITMSSKRSLGARINIFSFADTVYKKLTT